MAKKRSAVQKHRDLWKKFEMGDHLTTPELVELKSQAEASLPYLQSRPEFRLALVPTIHAINAIEGYLQFRSKNN